MKMTLALGILIALTTLTSCAPVASSSPKLGQQRRGDSGVIDSNKTEKKFDFGVVPADAEIVSVDNYDAYEKKNLVRFKTDFIKERDSENFEMRERHSIKKHELPVGRNRVEIKPIFVVDVPSKGITNGKEIKVNIFRGELQGNSSLFSFSINEEETSYENWNLIKKNLSRVVIAYRVVDPSDK